MERKINALKAAYRVWAVSKSHHDVGQLRYRALCVVNYYRKHPMAACLGLDRSAIIALADKIIHATAAM